MEPDEAYMNDKGIYDNVSNQSTTSVVNEISERRFSIERMKPTTPIKDFTNQNHSNNANHSTNNMLSNYTDKFSSQRTSTASESDIGIRRTSKQDKEVQIYTSLIYHNKCKIHLGRRPGIINVSRWSKKNRYGIKL